METPAVFAPMIKPARYKGTWGGRGSGKSWFWADLAVMYMATKQGFQIVCVREVQKSIADSVKRLMENRIEELGLSFYFTITEQEIRGLNGSLAIFRGLQNHTAASIKSLEGFHVAWVEEAQTISQKSLDLLTPTIRAAGSELWFSWNPGDSPAPVDNLLRENPPEGAIVIKANWSDNPFFPDELRADMERDKERDLDKYLHVWEGAYSTRTEANVFKNWKTGEITPPENAVWHYGVDWGFSVDPTAGLRCCFVDDKLYIDHEVGEVGCPMEKTPALISGLPGAQKWPIRADAARPETIDYMRRNGFPLLRAAQKGPGSIKDGIVFLQSFDIVVHPRCANVIRELGTYSYKTDKQTGEILPVVEDKNNHWLDALRYAVEHLHHRGKTLALSQQVHNPVADYGAWDDEDSDNWKTA